MGKLYSADELPQFEPGTTGLIALPSNTEFACVEAPRSVVLQGSPAGGSYVDGAFWPDSNPITLNQSDLHMLFSDDGHHGLALDAVLGDKATYGIVDRDLRPEEDARAAFLYTVWAQHRITPTVMLVRRSAPVNVLGQLPKGSEAAGCRFGGKGNPFYTLTPQCYLVTGALGIIEVVRKDDMERMFHALAKPGGEIVRELVAA